MDDWVWVESPGTALEEEPRALSAKFGDGYEQLAPDGLNDIVQMWPLQFNDIENAIASDMIDFLRSHRNTPFQYVPLWSTTPTVPIVVICRKWRRSQGNEWGYSSISCTFEQWFAP